LSVTYDIDKLKRIGHRQSAIIMKDDSQRSTSVWMATAETPPEPRLQQDIQADVCVIGAGIAGMTTAYLLSLEGQSVVVLDDGAIGGGMTGRTTAHLTNAFDDRYVEMEKMHGEDGARLIAASHSAAIDRIEKIVTHEGIDCGFERLDGFLFVPPGDSTKILDEELAASHRAGLKVERVGRAPLETFDTGPALRFSNQAQFHPLDYLTGLTKTIERAGGQLFTKTHATKISGGSNATVEVESNAIVSCDAIVVATNTPVNDLIAIHTKQAPYTTYVIGVRIPARSVTRALYWDTPDPYHYLRLQEDKNDPSSEILIVGGEDHKTGQANDGKRRFENLERWTRERFPHAGEVDFHWSGEVMEPVDGVAFIGRNPLDADNVFIATGDSGQGMTHGTIAGILLTDLLQGRKNEWEDLYSPSRITLRALPEYAQENINVAEQYTDLVTPGEIESVEEVARGEGAVMRHGLTKVAVYRDESGKVYKVSAICKHLGCVVAWNSTEKTWDCPCHGSRYDAHGRVYQGPANSNLEPVEE
jgi:glycine/D-amino acid oxidase-like deaminating enzyme/nitrite reductase/ring-hydroxylating ferredoxin subunit